METISVREMRERIAKVLDRVQSGEEVTVLRRGKPVARIVKPVAEHGAFRSRKGLREAIPPMRRASRDEVREQRDDERF